MAPKAKKSPSKPAVREVARTVDFLDSDQIARAIQAALHATSSNSVSEKRKASPDTLSDSEINSESSLPTPRKKRYVEMSPPKSSLLAVLDSAAPFDSPSRPKRTRIKSEKARLMDEDDDVVEIQRVSKVVRVAPPKCDKLKDRNAKSSSSKVSRPVIDVSDDDPLPPSHPSPIEISDDDLPPASTLSKFTPGKAVGNGHTGTKVMKGKVMAINKDKRGFEGKPSAREEHETTPRSSRKMRASTPVVSAEFSDVEADAQEEQDETTPRFSRKARASAPAVADDFVDVEAGASEAETSDGNDRAPEASGANESEGEGAVGDIAWSRSPTPAARPIPAARPVPQVEEDEDPSCVMLRSAQDPMMIPTYVNLPHIEAFADVTPYGFDATGGLATVRTNVMNVAKKMPEPDFQNLLAALMFTHYSVYINFARIDPALLAVDTNDRIRLRNSSTFGHGLMSGVIRASAIISSVIVGGVTKYGQHRVTIAPFAQEFRRDTSVWGQLLDFTVISATTSHLGFSFVTRGDNQQSSYSKSAGPSVPSTPTKASDSDSDMFTSVQSPAAPRVRRGIQSSAFRNFEDRIPVYDGRSSVKPFRFKPADFDNLQDWPLYKGGNAELPKGSVVTVGYSVGTYRGNSTKYLSTNALFVILLSIPEKVVG